MDNITTCLSQLYGFELQGVDCEKDVLTLIFTCGTKLEFFYEPDEHSIVFINGSVFSTPYVEGFKPYYNKSLQSITKHIKVEDDADCIITKTNLIFEFKHMKFEVHWLYISDRCYEKELSYNIKFKRDE